MNIEDHIDPAPSRTAALVNDEIAQRKLPDPDGDVPEDVIEKPFRDQIAEIVGDAQELAKAEVAYYRAKFELNFGVVKKVMAYFGFGLALVTAGLTALVLGLLMTLAPYVGPGAATAMIAGLFIISGSAFIVSSVRRARKLPLHSDELDKNDLENGRQ